MKTVRQRLLPAFMLVVVCGVVAATVSRVYAKDKQDGWEDAITEVMMCWKMLRKRRIASASRAVTSRASAASWAPQRRMEAWSALTTRRCCTGVPPW